MREEWKQATYLDTRPESASALEGERRLRPLIPASPVHPQIPDPWILLRQARIVEDRQPRPSTIGECAPLATTESRRPHGSFLPSIAQMRDEQGTSRAHGSEEDGEGGRQEEARLPACLHAFGAHRRISKYVKEDKAREARSGTSAAVHLGLVRRPVEQARTATEGVSGGCDGREDDGNRQEKEADTHESRGAPPQCAKGGR
ncbi:hypothetical protein B0H11DRAFT_2201163 [Mycena galericulata]|nr:hypothetical protein B0H11DRAFT_2201163 [Mycena galericulata]